MRVLVTGSTGFIGSHVVEELLRRGFKVRCLVRDTSDLKWLEGLDVSLHRGDCRDRESLPAAVDDVDYIFHLAGLTRAPRERDFFEVNVKGTENLIRAARDNNPSLKRFLFLSSLAAVGPSTKEQPANEDTAPRPVSSYGRSKLEAEGVVMKYSAEVPVTIVRAAAVYGPRDRDFCLLYKMVKRGIFPYWGKSYYSLVYVEDLVKGMIEAALSKEAVGKTFFISDCKVYSNDEIASAISQAVGSRPIRLPLPHGMIPFLAGLGRFLGRNGSIINRDKVKELSHSCWVCDSTRATRELGLAPRTNMNEGFKWTANWYKIHQWL